MGTKTLSPTIGALIAAVRAEPHDSLHRLVLADALEEAGDKRSEEVRRMQPEMIAVLNRLAPETLKAWNVQRHGKSWQGISMVFRDMITSNSPLIPRPIETAIEIERGLAVLALFPEATNDF